MNYQHIHQILQEIDLYKEKNIIQNLYYLNLNLYIKNSKCSLYYGLKSRIDLSLSKIILRYYIFNYLYFKYAFKNYISPKFKDDDESGYDITPDNATVYPLLRYAKMTDPLVLLFAAISNFTGMIASHPINILKIRLQNEILQQHQTKSYTQKMIDMTKVNGNKLWLKTGFGSRFLYTYLQFVSEMTLFQYCLNKLGFEFMNVFRPQVDYKGNIISVGISIIGTSLLSSLLIQPIFLYHQRQVYKKITNQKDQTIKQFFMNIYKQEKFQGFFKGYIQNTIRSTIRNCISVGVLWHFATQANKERFRPSEE